MLWFRIRQASMAALVSVPLVVFASHYPDKPVRVVVPTLAGSTADIVARVVTPGMGLQLGHRFIVDNRSGADGLIGTELAAKATPDGYTLLVGTTGTLTVMHYLRKDVAFDTLKDFAPIGLLSVRWYLLAAHPGLQVQSVPDLVALARKQAGRMSYASAGSGSSIHLAMERFDVLAGIDLKHVPYKGSVQAALAIVGGRVPVGLVSLRNASPYLASQRLRALAVTSARRVPQLPAIPTIAESGLPGFEAMTWFALVAPARTPRDIVLRLNDTVQHVIRSPEVRDQLAREGLEPGYGDAVRLQGLIQRDIELYGKLTRTSGVSLN